MFFSGFYYQGAIPDRLWPLPAYALDARLVRISCARARVWGWVGEVVRIYYTYRPLGVCVCVCFYHFTSFRERAPAAR